MTPGTNAAGCCGRTSSSRGWPKINSISLLKPFVASASVLPRAGRRRDALQVARVALAGRWDDGSCRWTGTQGGSGKEVQKEEFNRSSPVFVFNWIISAESKHTLLSPCDSVASCLCIDLLNEKPLTGPVHFPGRPPGPGKHINPVVSELGRPCIMCQTEKSTKAAWPSSPPPCPFDRSIRI